jgi:hypothetical protein
VQRGESRPHRGFLFLHLCFERTPVRRVTSKTDAGCRVVPLTRAGRVPHATISEKALAQSLGQPTLTALAATILARRKNYCEVLEASNKLNEITNWLM